MKALFLTAILSLISLNSNAALFGADNRSSVSQGSPYTFVGKATAIAVLSTNLIENKAQNTIDIEVDSGKLCKDERFGTQPNLSFACTGFLVAPDLLVTAGHCVYAVNTEHEEHRHETKLACEAFSWLFDFAPNAADQTQTKNIPADRLYRCKEIIYGVQNQKAPWSDYALIRLDRPATGRTPLKMSTAPLSKTTSLSLLGYPFGSPLKISNAAHVRTDNPARQSFITTLDAFEGNSGGPVLNVANEVVGLLVGGTPMMNTYEDIKNKCERVNRCNEEATRCNAVDDSKVMAELRLQGFQSIGSEVQRIQPIVELIKSLK